MSSFIYSLLERQIPIFSVVYNKKVFNKIYIIKKYIKKSI